MACDSDLGVCFLQAFAGGSGYRVQGHARGRVFAVRGHVYSLVRQARDFVKAELVPAGSDDGTTTALPR